MTAQKIEESDVVADRGEFVNDVRLVGRVAADPEERVLASGEVVLNIRLAVPRPLGKGSERQKSDSIECTVWTGRLKRNAAKWAIDDVVEVTGTLQRRFFRTGGATASRVEVELDSGRITRRAANG